MSELKVGDIVIVEQAWEDETGFYHDEYAVIESFEPLKLNWLDVTDEARSWLEQFEFTVDPQLMRV